MPSTKNALMRYYTIDECLRNTFHLPERSYDPSHRGLWTVNELLDRIYEKTGIEISERQLSQDIHDMRNGDLGYYAPIENLRGVGYFYADPNFRISDNPLTDEDVRILNDAIEVFHQFKGFRDFERIDGLLIKLEEKINKKPYPLVQLDNLNDAKGIEWIRIIKEAIRRENALKLVYETFGGKRSERFIHPYVLKEYNNRWFVYCYSEDYQSDGIYALDRILDLVKVKIKYIKPTASQIEDYFKNIIGVTNEKSSIVSRIIIKVKNARARYLVTKPLHNSQEIIGTEKDCTRFSFQLKINNELVSLFLSFGSDLLVEEPLQLKEEMKKIFSDALEMYST